MKAVLINKILKLSNIRGIYTGCQTHKHTERDNENNNEIITKYISENIQL